MKRIICVSAILLFFSFSLLAQEKKEFVPNGRPIVQVFASSVYDFSSDNKKQYDFTFGRAHLGYQYWFSPNWSAKVIIDRGRPTTVGVISAVDSEGNPIEIMNASKEGAHYTMFLKFASIRWKVDERLTIEGGAILQNHYITQERFWGMRYVAQTFQDMYWHISSSDLGFIAYYNLNKVISFDAAFTNGEGSRVKQDPDGDAKYAVGIDIKPLSNVQARVYYHNKKSVREGSDDEQMYSAFLGWKVNDKFRIGGEYNHMNNLWNVESLKSEGFSIYSICSISSKTELFARYDRLLFNAPQDIQTALKGNGSNVIGGVSYSPLKKINLSLNYQGWLSDNSQNESRLAFSIAYKF